MRSVEYLVSRGHRVNDVLRVYTLDQIQAFVEAGDMRSQEDHLAFAAAHRAAMMSDKHWRSYVQESRMRMRHAEEERDPTPMTKERIKALQKVLGGKWKGSA